MNFLGRLLSVAFSCGQPQRSPRASRESADLEDGGYVLADPRAKNDAAAYAPPEPVLHDATPTARPGESEHNAGVSRGDAVASFSTSAFAGSSASASVVLLHNIQTRQEQTLQQIVMRLDKEPKGRADAAAQREAQLSAQLQTARRAADNATAKADAAARREAAAAAAAAQREAAAAGRERAAAERAISSEAAFAAKCAELRAVANSLRWERSRASSLEESLGAERARADGLQNSLGACECELAALLRQRSAHVASAASHASPDALLAAADALADAAKDAARAVVAAMVERRARGETGGGACDAGVDDDGAGGAHPAGGAHATVAPAADAPRKAAKGGAAAAVLCDVLSPTAACLGVPQHAAALRLVLEGSITAAVVTPCFLTPQWLASHGGADAVADATPPPCVDFNTEDGDARADAYRAARLARLRGAATGVTSAEAAEAGARDTRNVARTAAWLLLRRFEWHYQLGAVALAEAHDALRDARVTHALHRVARAAVTLHLVVTSGGHRAGAAMVTRVPGAAAAPGELVEAVRSGGGGGAIRRTCPAAQEAAERAHAHVVGLTVAPGWTLGSRVLRKCRVLLRE